MNNQQLGKQVLQEIHKYDTLAKKHQHSCLDTNLLKDKMGINTKQWIEIKIGSSKISPETFQMALGMIKQMHFALAQRVKNEAKENITMIHGLTQPFASNNQKIAQSNKNTDRKYKDYKYKYSNKVYKGKIITLIKPQKRNQDRFNIYINKKYAFPVSAAVIGKYFLYPGRKLTNDIIKKIKHSDDISKILSKIIKYVAKGMHSKAKVKQKLTKYTKSQALINETITKLEKMNLVNDKKFAKLYVKDKIELSNQGPYQIKRKLYQKHINPEYVQKALQEFASNTQLQHAKKLVKEKFNIYQDNTPFRKAKLKTKMALMRKGYPNDIISKAIEQDNLQKDTHKEQQLLQRKLNFAKNKYKRYAKKNSFQYKMKIKQYLLRQQFSFDEIENIL